MANEENLANIASLSQENSSRCETFSKFFIGFVYKLHLLLQVMYISEKLTNNVCAEILGLLLSASW